MPTKLTTKQTFKQGTLWGPGPLALTRFLHVPSSGACMWRSGAASPSVVPPGFCLSGSGWPSIAYQAPPADSACFQQKFFPEELAKQNVN